MATRRINHPDVEINEYDRSNYDLRDNALVGTAVMLQGFADKGDDYQTKWINSMNSFIQNYGYPQNEAERYFYNGAFEVLNRGGYLFASKLPYDNKSLDQYSFVSYKVGNSYSTMVSPYDIATKQHYTVLTAYLTADLTAYGETASLMDVLSFAGKLSNVLDEGKLEKQT